MGADPLILSDSISNRVPESTFENQNDSQINDKPDDGQQTPALAAHESSDGAGDAAEHETAAYEEQGEEDEEAGVTVEGVAKVRIFAKKSQRPAPNAGRRIESAPRIGRADVTGWFTTP